MKTTAKNSGHKMAERPVKGICDFVTLGSKTARGGEVVTASTGSEFDSHPIARVGDVVRYPDGSESRIVSGAGFAAAVNRQPIAIVGWCNRQRRLHCQQLAERAQHLRVRR